MAKREKRNRNKGSVGNNRKTATDFLVKNKKKDGVTETTSGLQYIVIDEGDGNKPDNKSIITVHQRCQLINGTIIEDTYKENKPSEVKMEELISAYSEGVMLMKKGSRYKFFIQSELAWGKKGSGTKIPPNALLIFYVILIDFNLDFVSKIQIAHIFVFMLSKEQGVL
jgi:FKBP-type peptidyl-prolyl cis-trans isomerase